MKAGIWQCVKALNNDENNTNIVRCEEILRGRVKCKLNAICIKKEVKTHVLTSLE